MKLKIQYSWANWLALFFLICSAPLIYAQADKATLLLQGGEELPCQIKRVAHGYVYFEAATKSLAYKYGDFIEVEKVAALRLNDGRTLTLNEYLVARGWSQPAADSPAPQMRPQTATAPAAPPRSTPSPSGPGMRLSRQALDSSQAANAIGLRLPDLPLPPAEAAVEFDYAELANLLAEAGLVGKLLNEINSGVLVGRLLTKSQKQLLDVIAQNPVWTARKNALREAQRVAAAEFNRLTRRQPEVLGREFRFQPVTRNHAFEEFVQFLHLQNVLHFQEQWQKVEAVFEENAATALRDILSNYDDWYFLFGEALEKR
ncbi:MAG: hypothetical protein ALAOOOJD_01082 [bacterium]|nr:hypothetical protein [bacterium]